MADKQDVTQETEASTSKPTNMRKSEFNLRSGDKEDVAQETEASTLTAKAYRAKKRVLGTPSDQDVSESNSSSQMRIHHTMHQAPLTQMNPAMDHQARKVKDPIL